MGESVSIAKRFRTVSVWFMLLSILIAAVVAICFQQSQLAWGMGADVHQPSISSTVALMESEGVAPIPTLQITKKPKTVKAGKSVFFKAKATNIDGAKTKWSTSNKKVATITNKGKLTGKRVGTVRVTVKYGSLKRTAKIRIEPKKIVALDPGHSSKVSGGREQIAPGSSTYKAKDNHGTAGRYTRVPEYKVTMKVANKLKKILEDRGYKVVLTRKDNSKAVSCKKRALIANKAKADIFLRIHCDGAGSSYVHGISMQSPGTRYKWVRKNHGKIVKLSKCILNATCKATGAKSKGVYYRNDLTGNNWAKMPVTLIEMGFMTNPTEDRKLVKESYQNKLAKGMANGIDRYFGYKVK